MNRPQITVIMSVYKEPVKWIQQSIDSILNQTFGDFEFLIVNDCPERSENKEILGRYEQNDNRVKVIVNEENIGLTRSLNKALDEAKGNYIARMDADDISMPERLERQYRFLELHKEISIIHSYITIFDDIDKNGKVRIGPLENKAIVESLMCSNSINHPAVMLRKSVFDKLGIKYNEEYRRSQDYELWLHAASLGCKFATIPEPLLLYRVSDNQITVSHRKEQLADENKIKQSFFKRLCETYNLKYPKQITRNYIVNFNISGNNQNARIIQNALKFQLYYTLPISLKKFIQIIPDSYRLGFSMKQTIILFLSFLNQSRWSGFNMNYLINK